MSKLILRTTTVKRSMKEFLLLQSQLEESPLWKVHLRGIKSPKTWLSLPFSSNSHSAHRRLLLQRYLQQVSSHPVLGFCPELRHFMAYGDDGFQMFAPLPNTHHIPRFDRLTKTFTGVLNSLKDALPSFESEMQQQETTAEPKSKKLLPSFLQFGDKNSDEELKVKRKEAVSHNGSPKKRVKISKIPLFHFRRRLKKVGKNRMRKGAETRGRRIPNKKNLMTLNRGMTWSRIP